MQIMVKCLITDMPIVERGSLAVGHYAKSKKVKGSRTDEVN
jgi:hypothetical protein